MAEKKAYDMHCHTKISDGYLTLKELAELAKKENLEGFAVTDHDNIHECKETKYLSESTGLDIIPGVELSGKLEGHLVEVTGYFVNPFDEGLEEICKINRAYREARVKDMLHKLNEKYTDRLETKLAFEEVLSFCQQGTITLHHINDVLVKRGLFKGRQAFDICLDRNTPESCYVGRTAVDLRDALEKTIKAGGIVGLPHPILTAIDCGYSDEEFFEMMQAYLGKEIRLIETDYPYAYKAKKIRNINLEESESFWIGVAEKYGLIKLGGSDGHQKPEGPRLGEKTTSKETIDYIKELIEKK